MKFLLLLLISFTVNAQNFEGHLTLYVSPSPLGIDWSSPTKLLGSIQLNRLSLNQRPLGVVYSEVQCDQQRQVVTSYYQELDLFNRLALEQQGLGVLFSNFPGELETGKQIESELIDRLAAKKIRFIRFAINEGQCQRLQKYLSEYISKKVGRNWGLPHRPEAGEGGTSIALAVSLLDVLGFKDEIYNEGWTTALQVPIELIGAPINEKSISPLRLIGSQWARPTEAARSLLFWDKEKMNKWLELNQGNFPNTTIDGVSGLLIDRRHFPVIQKSFWRQNVR